MHDKTVSPTPKQLAYIKRLSGARGLSFAKPKTIAAASRQIEALKAMPASRSERQLEQDLGQSIRPGGTAATFRRHEITGYGSTCTWS